MTRRTWLPGAALLLLAFAAGELAHARLPLLWPVAFAAAWLGAARWVAAQGCGFAGSQEAAGSPDSCGTVTSCGRTSLDRETRRRRLRSGAGFGTLAAASALLAAWDCPGLWPLASVAAWFSAAFIVAAATAYPGCPELGAIPSLVLRRRLKTSCPPLEGPRS